MLNDFLLVAIGIPMPAWASLLVAALAAMTWQRLRTHSSVLARWCFGIALFQGTFALLALFLTEAHRISAEACIIAILGLSDSFALTPILLAAAAWGSFGTRVPKSRGLWAMIAVQSLVSLAIYLRSAGSCFVLPFAQL